jgi:lysophospholipase L1-like esterase
MKIIFITDSFGGPRIHNGIEEVNLDHTYPELVKKELTKLGHEVQIDYASFRKVTDLPEIVKKQNNYDLYIIQTGIVDLYPRALTHKYTISQKRAAKLLRRIIRLNRSFFIKYIYNKPWSTENEVRDAFETVCSNSKADLILINVAPVNAFQERESPGANAAIKKINAILSEVKEKHAKCLELDIFDLLLQTKDYESYLHSKDSHLNIKGNIFYANELLKLVRANYFNNIYN